MKLLNDFYDIEECLSSGEELRYRISFNPSHRIYMAHFPNNPVTPGVCLVQIAQELLEHECGRKLSLVTAKSIKFRQIIKPETVPTFIMSKKAEGDMLKVAVNVADDATQYIKMSLIYSWVS